MAGDYYGPPGSGQAVQDGSVGAALADQSDHNQKTIDASGRGAVVGGDASAKTSMGGGSGGGGGGGSGGGGGGGGYSLGQSNADSTTQSLGFSGEASQHTGNITHGAHTVNFGGTQTTGLTGRALAIILGGVAALGLVAALVLRRRR